MTQHLKEIPVYHCDTPGCDQRWDNHAMAECMSCRGHVCTDHLRIAKLTFEEMHPPPRPDTRESIVLADQYEVKLCEACANNFSDAVFNHKKELSQKLRQIVYWLLETRETKGEHRCGSK